MALEDYREKCYREFKFLLMYNHSTLKKIQNSSKELTKL